MYGQAFHHNPFHARLADQLLPFADIRYGPDLSDRDLMQGSYDTADTTFPDIPEGYRIVRAIPPHGLLHFKHSVLV
jgi:hypothetical protein